MKDCKIYYILILVLIFFIYQTSNDTIEGYELAANVKCLYIKEQDCSDNNCPTPTDGVKIMKIDKKPATGTLAPPVAVLTEPGEGRRSRDGGGCIPSALDTPPLPITYDGCYQECLALDGTNGGEECTYFAFAPNREIGLNVNAHLNGKMRYGLKLAPAASSDSDYYNDMSISTVWEHEHTTGEITDYNGATKEITVEWNRVIPSWLTLAAHVSDATQLAVDVDYVISDNRGSGKCCLKKAGSTELDEDTSEHWIDSDEDMTFNKLIRRDDEENPDFRHGSVINGGDKCNQTDCTELDYTSNDETCENGYKNRRYCTETATTSVDADAAACAAVTALDDNAACGAVTTVADSNVSACTYNPSRCEYDESQHNNYCIRAPTGTFNEKICDNNGLDEASCLQLPIFSDKHKIDDGEIECKSYDKFEDNIVCEAKYDKMCENLSSENCNKAGEYCKINTSDKCESKYKEANGDCNVLRTRKTCNEYTKNDIEVCSYHTTNWIENDDKKNQYCKKTNYEGGKLVCDYGLEWKGGSYPPKYEPKGGPGGGTNENFEHHCRKRQQCYQVMDEEADILMKGTCGYIVDASGDSSKEAAEEAYTEAQNVCTASSCDEAYCTTTATCIEAAAGSLSSVQADVESCAAVTALGDNTACGAVTTAADSTVYACTYSQDSCVPRSFDCGTVTELDSASACNEIKDPVGGTPLCTYTPKEYSDSQIEGRTCNNEGVFDPVPYFYNIENAYSSCVGTECDITSEKREGSDDDFGYPSLDKFRCCAKQGTCARSKHDEITNKANEICVQLPDPDPEREGEMLAYDRRMDLDKCEYRIRVSEIVPTENLKLAQAAFNSVTSSGNETTLATAKSALETAQNEQLRNSDQYQILTDKPYDCLTSEVGDKCCRSRMQCDSTGWDDRNKITGEISDEIVMKCPEGKYLDDSKNENLCEKAVCMKSRDEGECCTSQAKCGNTPDPITHPSGTVGPTVPTKTAKPGETLAITDEDCGAGYKYNLNSLYQYCVGTVCNPLKVPEDKERCCVPDETTDTSSDESENLTTPTPTVEETTTTTVSEEDNTMMYIGIGVVVLMILGGLGFLLMSDSGGKVKIKKIKAK